MPLTPQNTDPNVGVLVPVITKPGQPSHQADAVWGGIVGTLSNQTDLQNALDAKAAASHNHDGVYVKPDSLAAVATSGDYDDLLNKPRRAWRELIVADGVTPPTFLLNEAGTDYLYSEFIYE